MMEGKTYLEGRPTNCEYVQILDLYALYALMELLVATLESYYHDGLDIEEIQLYVEARRRAREYD